MDILNQACNFKFMFTTLFLLCLLSCSVSSPHSSNSNQEIQPRQNPSSTVPALTRYHHHQVFYLKNTDPAAMVLRRQERMKQRKRSRMNRNKNMMKQRKKKMIKNQSFSVMLPKGFVPPSGSSPCHNDQPDSVSFHCDFTDTTKP